jgi:AcrR family transcriptional regulator
MFDLNVAHMNTRSYSMEKRARQAEATRQRILEAAQALVASESAGFTLDSVAASAGTSVQTVLRVFGSKDALIVAAIGTFRDDHRSFEVPDSPRLAVAQVVDDYERIGDRVIRMLAEEHNVIGFADGARLGRANHRLWVETVFATQLRRHRARPREGILIALIAATDVYIWKLLRRDLGLDRAAAESVIVRLVEGALGSTTTGRNS